MLLASRHQQWRVTGLPCLEVSTQRRVVNAEFFTKASKPSLDSHEAKGSRSFGTALDEGPPESVGAQLAKAEQGSGSLRFGHQAGDVRPCVGSQQVACAEEPAEVQCTVKTLVGVGLVFPYFEIVVHT